MTRIGLALALALAAGLGAPPAACAQSVNAKALEEINAFAASFCGEYYREGSSRQFGAEGSAQAELDGLLKKLTTIGVKGAAEFDSKAYVGVLQTELSGELKSVRDCRLKIWNDLKGAVIEAPPPNPPPPVVRRDFLYPFTETTRLISADLAGYDKAQLRVMRNEIYARHGYRFQSADLRALFGGMPWYRPQTSDAGAVLQSMSEVERANVLTIKAAEAAR